MPGDINEMDVVSIKRVVTTEFIKGKKSVKKQLFCQDKKGLYHEIRDCNYYEEMLDHDSYLKELGGIFLKKEVPTLEPKNV